MSVSYAHRFTELMSKEVFDLLPAVRVVNGHTDYIDTLCKQTMTLSDGTVAPIAVFRDAFGRVGIAMHMYVLGGDNQIMESAYFAAFQRYSDSNSTWVFCVSHGKNMRSRSYEHNVANILQANTLMKEHSFETLRNIIAAWATDRSGLLVHTDTMGDCSVFIGYP